MRVFLITVCVCMLLIQIRGENVNNQVEENKLTKNIDFEELVQNNTEVVNKCIVQDIINQIEELLKKQLQKGDNYINSVMKPKESVTILRKVRETQEPFDFEKCVLKSELEQHKNMETENINAIKQELEKLKDLVRFLRDQQYILNMLNDFDNRQTNNIENEQDQKKLIELFQMLQDNLPQQTKLDHIPLPAPNENPNREDLQKIMIELDKLQKQLEDHSRNGEDQLKAEIMNQRNQLEELQSQIEHLKKGQAVFVHVSPKNPDPNNHSEIVGANLPTQPASPLFNKLKSNASSRKSSQNTHKPSSSSQNQKVRASDDEFLENLQRLLDSSEVTPEIKEDPLDLPLNSNSDVENRLQDLEKQLKISTKIEQLEKKIKQLHKTNAESKSDDEDDEDLKIQLKKLQKQLKNINKSKVESKDLDEGDILEELKNLQTAISDLRPKEDDSQSKIGSAELQVMLNKIAGVPATPVRPVSTHSHFTPAQIQILKRVMAMKTGHSSGKGNHGYGLNSGEPSFGSVGHYAGIEDFYSSYGPSTGGAPYDGYYNGDFQSASYGPSIEPYNSYGPALNPYNLVDGGYASNNAPVSYGQFAATLGPYGYATPPLAYNNHYNVANGYRPSLTKGKYQSSNKYGSNNPMSHYLFRGLHHHSNSGQSLKPYPGPITYPVATHGLGNSYATPYASQGVNVAYRPSPIEYAPQGGYASNPVHPVLYTPPVQYGNNAYNKPPYPPTNDNGKNGYIQPAPKAYNQEDQFFRGYQNAEAANYQSDAPQPYTNLQENSYQGDSYSQQKMEDLQTQIYKLQNVINNLSGPEYAQKPEDQQTIYELDHKISDLKSVVNNLAHDSYQPNYADGNSYNYGGEGVKPDGYDISPKSSRSRFRRNLDEVEKTKQNSTVLQEFLQHVDDILSVINYLSNEWQQAVQNQKNTTEQLRKKRDIPNTLLNQLLGTVHSRRVREVDSTNNVLNQLNNLSDFVDYLTKKVLKWHQNSTMDGSSETDENKKSFIRKKRDVDESGEEDDSGSGVLGTLATLMHGLINADSKSSEEEESSNQIRKEFQSNPQILQKKLDHLKQQF